MKKSAKLKLGMNNNSMKSVTLPLFEKIKLYPLSPRFPKAPPRINIKE